MFINLSLTLSILKYFALLVGTPEYTVYYF